MFQSQRGRGSPPATAQVVQEKLAAMGLEPVQEFFYVGHLGSKRRVLQKDQDLFLLFKEKGKALPSIEVPPGP